MHLSIPEVDKPVRMPQVFVKLVSETGLRAAAAQEHAFTC